MPVLAHLHHSLYPVLSANVAGVDANFAGSGLSRRNGQLVIKVNIRNQGQHAFLTDLRKATGSLHIGHCQPDNLAAGRRQRTDLGKGALHIRGFGIQHGLDHNIRAAADGDTANHYLSGHGQLPLYHKK